MTHNPSPPVTGLLPFILGMLTATPDQLAKAVANADRVAARHGISAETVRFNLAMWRGR